MTKVYLVRTSQIVFCILADSLQHFATAATSKIKHSDDLPQLDVGSSLDATVTEAIKGVVIAIL